MGAGITLLRAWASAGTRIKPSDGKIDQGWLAGEQPPMEYENERMNTRDAKVNEILAYLNAGVPLADIVTSATDTLTISDSNGYGSFNANGFTTVNDVVSNECTYGMFPTGFASVLSSAGSSVTSIRFISIDLTGATWSQVDDIDSGSLYRFRINTTLPTFTNVPATASTQVLSAVLIDNSSGYSINCEANVTYSGASELIVSDIYATTALYSSLSIKSLNLILGDVTASI